MAMLQVVLPKAFVNSARHVLVLAIPISLVSAPLTDVSVTIRMDELSLSASSVVPPLAFVAGAVGPLLDAVAVSHAVEPLTLIS